MRWWPGCNSCAGRRAPAGQPPARPRPHRSGRRPGRVARLAQAAPASHSEGWAARSSRQERGLSAALPGRQRLPRLGFPGTGGTTQLLARFEVLITLLEQLLVDRALARRLAGRRIDAHPALLDLARGRGQRLRAIALPQRGHGLRVGLGQSGVRFAHRRGDTGDPLHRGLGELLEMLCAGEGTSGHQAGPARGRVPLAQVFADDLAQVLGVPPIATAGLHPHGHASLVFDNHVQPPLVESRAMVPAVATRDVHDLLCGLLVTGIAAIHVQARAIERRKSRREPKALSGRGGNETVECRHPRGIEGIHGTPEGVIIALCGGDPGRNALGRGRIVKEPGNQGERLVDTPQAIAHHRFDGLTDGEVPHCRVLVRRLSEDVANAECVAHASDKAEVV